MNQDDAKKRIAVIEAAMMQPDFWTHSEKAQAMIREMQELKAVAEGGDTHDRGSAIVSILAGAGGDDAEDFVGILLRMYQGYAVQKGWGVVLFDESENDHGGYRSVTFQVSGKGAYGRLKHEAGVHRLVRRSPFNANDKRQTSFAMVEVFPEVLSDDQVSIRDEDLEISFAKSGGAGGQNVNKRETAVRIVHTPTNLSVHVSSERSQAANRERGLALIKAKLLKREEEIRYAERAGRSVSKTTANEWGSQIRSYVLHPYKLVKDHRTEHEMRDVDAVFSGDVDAFIDAHAQLTP